MTPPRRFPASLLMIVPWVLAALCPAQSQFHLKLDLDKVIAPPGVWDLTPDTLGDKCPAEGLRENPFFGWVGRSNGAKDRAIFNRNPYANVEVDLTVFGGKVPVQEAVLDMQDGKVSSVRIVISGADADTDPDPASVKKYKEACEGALSSMLGASGSPAVRLAGLETAKNAQTLFFKGQPAVATMDHNSGDRLLGFALAPPGTAKDAMLSRAFRATRGSGELFVNLDPLLTLPGLWSLTPDMVEKAFAVAGAAESPFYQWLTSDRSGVRFSRRPYSDVSVDLSLFHGSVPVEEAVIEFSGGKASRVTVSLYNRGDGGEIERQEFERRYKTAGVNVAKVVGVRPVERKPSKDTATKISGWIWTAPAALASLEYNTEALAGGRPEFLRLKLVAPTERDAFAVETGQSFRKAALGKAELPRFVKRTLEGDSYVGSVPMVDQGAKGYCVAAACQRLFGYLGITVDQHELATVAGTDAQRGTGLEDMERALRMIDSRFKVNFKPLGYRIAVDRLGVPVGNRISAVDETKFAKLVREHTDKGIPLLWAVQLGIYPENPPNAAQAGGGHMRLIIGANEKSGELLFTDSWGSGHELKRMKMADAFKATMAVWVVEPKEH